MVEVMAVVVMVVGVDQLKYNRWGEGVLGHVLNSNILLETVLQTWAAERRED